MLASQKLAIAAHLHALLAPANGVIAKSNALNGQVIEPSHVLFEVIDPGRLLIEANTADAAVAQQVQGGSIAIHFRHLYVHQHQRVIVVLP